MATRSPERKTRHIPFPGQLFINLTRPYAYENRPLIRFNWTKRKKAPATHVPTIPRLGGDGFYCRGHGTGTRRSQQHARNVRQMGISEPFGNVAPKSKIESPCNLIERAPYVADESVSPGEVFATSPRRYAEARTTPEYHGYTSLPIEVRMRMLCLPMPDQSEVVRHQ
jgi:hypothetical protein